MLFDPKTYGAKGGTHDDTAAIIAAATHANKYGGTVHLEAHQISASLPAFPNVAWQGDSQITSSLTMAPGVNQPTFVLQAGQANYCLGVEFDRFSIYNPLNDGVLVPSATVSITNASYRRMKMQVGGICINHTGVQTQGCVIDQNSLSGAGGVIINGNVNRIRDNGFGGINGNYLAGIVAANAQKATRALCDVTGAMNQITGNTAEQGTAWTPVTLAQTQNWIGYYVSGECDEFGLNWMENPGGNYTNAKGVSYSNVAFLFENTLCLKVSTLFPGQWGDSSCAVFLSADSFTIDVLDTNDVWQDASALVQFDEDSIGTIGTLRGRFVTNANPWDTTPNPIIRINRWISQYGQTRTVIDDTGGTRVFTLL